MGKLIVIDGVDASGKQTHTQLILKRLADCGKNVKLIAFPDYDSKSSELVKMYLSGEFGENPDSVNAYAASSFFAADRFASFKTKWQSFYEEDDSIIVADRYVSSNMIHQASKICDNEEKSKFLEWLFHLEYVVYGLPKPDLTFFLDMPTEIAKSLMKERDNKFDKDASKDIHERNADYLEKSYKNACFIADKFMWEHIMCAQNGEIRTIEDINDEIFEKIIKII